MKLATALASFAVGKALTEAQVKNDCYDYWKEIEESGVTQFDELVVAVGSNMNGGTLTAVGTGGGLNFGRLHLTHVATDGDFTVETPMGTEGLRGMTAGVGANVGLSGSTATAVDTGVGLTNTGAVTNIDLYKGNVNNLHVPGFNHMNGGLGNENIGLGGNIHRQGTGYTVGHAMPQPMAINNGGLRRRLQKNECAPPQPSGGKPVTCASTGDPHIVDFHGNKFDHMAFGEFRFYNSWVPYEGFSKANLMIQVRNGPFQGRSPTISSNQGVAIGGNLACGNKIEIHKANSANISKLKITRRNGQVVQVDGRDQIYAALSQESCPKVQIENNVAHFVFEEDQSGDRTTLRVQIVSYGLNLGLDVIGGTNRRDTDRGICTKNAGWDQQVDCMHSLFTMYPAGGCQGLQRGGHRGGPAVECPTSLFQQAERVCGKCPETVNPEGCVYDICALGGIEFADEVLSACQVGVRLPARLTVNTGVNYNMEGATAIAVGRGTGINYGVANVRVHDMNG